ncbi:hypothetical protein VTK26DRAFT_4742 [Humicola hyalothermophila]
MEQTSLAAAAAPPIPRKSRERDRPRHTDKSRDQTHSANPRRDPLHSIPSPDADPRDPFADWTATRDRERHADRHAQDGDDDVAPLPPASPEVISSLITSLSAISRPVSNHFDGPSYLSPIGSASPLSLSIPASPTGGSFGVDYGAYKQPSLKELQEEDVPLEELPASAPVVRTSKPPSGFSPLTAPKSPRSPGARDSTGLLSMRSRRSSGGLSRPSSRGSLASGAESIGKLSIERGPEPLPTDTEGHSLKKQKSFDSWGRKTARHQRSLMYMSSKERLRDIEVEKRPSAGAVGGNSASGPTTLLPLSPESTINEEPHMDSGTKPDGEPGDTLRLIPVRDSSLRKASGSARRSSARTSRTSKRDSDGTAYGTIPEHEEQNGGARDSRNSTAKRRHSGQKHGHGLDPLRLSADLPQENPASLSKPTPDVGAATPSTPGPSAMFFDTDLDEGAPSPAVAQGRRRDREASAEYRRRSGRMTPDPFGGYVSEGGGTSIKVKRSSARLKRLSGAPSPTAEKAAEQNGATGGSTQTDQPHVAYERPRSADSIDDAVESYLCSPRLSQKIRHPQTGRVISFSEVGDPNGSAVFCCVGMGLTRYITAFYDELALTLKLRLITPDRPGVGDSEPYAEGTATPLSWPDDVYAICQSLKITKFSILAHSAGAIYALATALRMPQHIRGRIHLLAPWIPPSQMNVFGSSEKTPLPPTNAIPTSQRILRALPTPILKAANSSFMTATSSSITSSLPKQKRVKREKRNTGANASRESKDQPKGFVLGGFEGKENVPHLAAATEDMNNIKTSTNAPATTGGIGSQAHGIGHRHRRSNSQGMRRPSERDEHLLSTAAALAGAKVADRERQELYDNRLTHAIWQLATTGANPAVDLLVCLERRHTIGFRYVDITRPVVIHHGSRDTRVPVDNVRWLGKTMRRCEVRVLEGEGHGLMASAQVMGNVLMEISREWEEWSRVTGATKRGEHERARRATVTAG